MPMKEIVARTGNEAMAEAMRQINPDVVAAYPITPATEIVQIFSGFVADGMVDTEFITVESEHSAMSACIGASAAGVRVMTGTSSQGLLYMAEMLFIAAGLRCPIVLAEVNRALSAPINIHCDHSDTMAVRDSGWIQLFSENSQEAYDNLIQAVRISEHPDVLLPTMVTTDGFIISHGLEAIQLMPDAEVKEFVGRYRPKRSLLDVARPITLGALDFTDYYFEHRRQMADAMEKSLPIIQEVGREFEDRFGRTYRLFEEYRMDDAEVVLVALGSSAGTARVAVDSCRNQGKKAGLVKIRVYRPFPAQELAKALSRCNAIAVMDRSDALAGTGGPLFHEIRSALFDNDSRPMMKNYIYGLGGRDITVDQIVDIFENLFRNDESSQKEAHIQYVGVRE